MITLVAGTRPNFVKISPICRALAGRATAIEGLLAGDPPPLTAGARA
jgi:UDP-N-acetylglucosamine 2-epimerase